MSDLGLTMQYDDEHEFPFVEDDNGNITGDGHQDKAAFAELVNQYDELANQEPVPEEFRYTADDIAHLWATLNADGETMRQCPPDTPGALPITALWHVR